MWGQQKTTNAFLSEAARVLRGHWPQFEPHGFRQHGGGFSGAVILKVRTAAGDYCLRRWPAGSLPPQRLRGLHRLLRTTFEQGVRQVPVPVPAGDGDTIVLSGGMLWQLEPWMPGAADFWANPSETRLRNAIDCLARWHQAAVRFDPLPSEQPWFSSAERGPSPAVRERLQLIYDWHAGGLTGLKRAVAARPDDPFALSARRIVELFEKLSTPIAGELELLRALQFRLQPCLRDVWHDHILFVGDEVTGLIDASASRTENVATDLARLLGSLVGDEAAGWRAGLDEYARRRILTDDELALVRALDRSAVLLSGLTWLDRRFLRGQNWADPQRVLLRLQRILQRLEALAASRC